MSRAGSGHAPRQNFAPLLNKRREDVRTLVIDVIHPVHAEPANLLLPYIISLASLVRSTWASATGAPSRSARSASRPAPASIAAAPTAKVTPASTWPSTASA